MVKSRMQKKHGVRIGLDISAVVFVIHLTKIKVKKIHPWVLWLEAYIPTMGWLAYQYYMTGAYKNKNKTKYFPSLFCQNLSKFPIFLLEILFFTPFY